MANEASKKVEVGSAFDLPGKSWEIVKKNWQAFAFVNIMSLLSAFLALFPEYDNAERADFSSGLSGTPGFELGAVLGVGLFIGIVLLALNILLYTMFTVLSVRASEGKTPTVGSLFEAVNKNWLWLRLVGLFIVAALIVIAGLILLIIPGVIAFGRIVMSPYFMVDKDLSITGALKASNEMGKQFPGKVWAAIGVMFLITAGAAIISSVPAIGPLAGTIFSIAFSLVLVLRYQQLKHLKSVTVEK